MTRPVPHSRDMLLDQKKKQADKTSSPGPSVTSPAAVVAAACHGVRAPMPLDLMPSGRNPIVSCSAADSPRFPHGRFLPPLFSSSRMHAVIMLRDFALPNKPQVGCTRLVTVRLIAKYADVYTTSAFSATSCCSCR